MEAFKSLWKPTSNIAIPAYDSQDSVDLQVKSLLYMYKRFGIARSGDKLEIQSIPTVNEETLKNLDKLYNLQDFYRIVAESDPHRVLVDWPKNRYRAMLILPHKPRMEHLPKFSDLYFNFSILEPEASNDEYIRTLSLSNIYAEHSLPQEIKTEIAASVLRKHKSRDIETRNLIILEYLRLVATEVQVARIYKAMLGKLTTSPGASPGTSPGTSPLHSPLNSRSSSPVRLAANSTKSSHSRSPSPVRPGSPSRFPKMAINSAASSSCNDKLSTTPKLTAMPVQSKPSSPHPQPTSPGSLRLRIKNSQPNFKLTGNTPSLSSNSVTQPFDAGKKHILQQARLAVKARIEKEQKAINAQKQ